MSLGHTWKLAKRSDIFCINMRSSWVLNASISKPGGCISFNSNQGIYFVKRAIRAWWTLVLSQRPLFVKTSLSLLQRSSSPEYDQACIPYIALRMANQLWQGRRNGMIWFATYSFPPIISIGPSYFTSPTKLERVLNALPGKGTVRKDPSPLFKITSFSALNYCYCSISSLCWDISV